MYGLKNVFNIVYIEDSNLYLFDAKHNFVSKNVPHWKKFNIILAFE